MKKGDIVYGLFAVVVFGAMLFAPDFALEDREESQVFQEVGVVTRVVDGDTVHVRVGSSTESVRLLGVDTPEIRWPSDKNKEIQTECFAWEAREYLNDRLKDREVVLLSDSPQKEFDIYKRTLAYVILDGEDVSQALLEEGFAVELNIGEPYSKRRVFLEAEENARLKGLGLWGECI